jgi:hypothetical protein
MGIVPKVRAEHLQLGNSGNSGTGNSGAFMISESQGETEISLYGRFSIYSDEVTLLSCQRGPDIHVQATR